MFIYQNIKKIEKKNKMKPNKQKEINQSIEISETEKKTINKTTGLFKAKNYFARTIN